MKTFTLMILTCLGILCARAPAQSVLFDFENATRYSPFPVTLTVGGITAHFTATGQGYSIQSANALFPAPAGFSGLCIYPSSVYASDLLISFSQALTNLSVLYAPQELACDSSARMKVTAYMNTTLIGSATTNAYTPGTWPSETLAFTSPQGFNNVVIHYDAPPITGGDYGPVFMVDNLLVTPMFPTLQIALVAGQIQVGWPAGSAGFGLQACTNLVDPNGWFSVTNVPILTGTRNTVTLPVPATNSFYRLRQP